MSLHLQFSYTMKIDHKKLLDEILNYFRKHLPEHIAIGTLDDRTHIYVELNKEFQIQGKNPLKSIWQNFVPHLEKNTRNYRKFKNLFESRNLLNEVTHYYYQKDQESNEVLTLKEKIAELLEVDQKKEQELIKLREEVKEEKELLKNQNLCFKKRSAVVDTNELEIELNTLRTQYELQKNKALHLEQENENLKNDALKTTKLLNFTKEALC